MNIKAIIMRAEMYKSRFSEFGLGIGEYYSKQNYCNYKEIKIWRN